MKHLRNPGLSLRGTRIALRCIRATMTQSNGEKSMERLKGKTALVVGAGSIGPGWGNG
jgi:lactate dehydrogenase-like 2-hydroxyacid dehydrogenase